MIDKLTVEKIIDASQIVDVISDFVSLRKRGANYSGLCPFHNERTPSFSVSPTKGIYKCFSCGKAGNSVQFIMEHEQLSYAEALRYLAKKFGIEIVEREISEEERRLQSQREGMFIVNEFAKNYFIDQLHNTQDGVNVGKRYFVERAFREDIIKKFQLGYSPESKNALYKEAISKGYNKDLIIKTGLAYILDNGDVNDRFRGRVIFPVHTLAGKIVAFGGRILRKNDKIAKYVNSPESEIYSKSNELYGIYFAKSSISKLDHCFLVEGYTDVISMHQAGIENVVSSSGTSLTIGQIKKIQRFTNNLTVLYDGDNAGIKASLRGIDLLLHQGMNIKVVLLPQGEDPDSFAKSHSSSDFIGYIEGNSVDFITFKTNLLIDEAKGDPIRRSELIKDIVRSIAIIPEAINRSVYVRECSYLLSISEEILIQEVNKLKRKELEKEIMQPATPEQLPLPSSELNDLPSLPPPDFDGGDYIPVAQEEPQVNAFAENQLTKYEKAIIRSVVRYGHLPFGTTEEGGTISIGGFICQQIREEQIVFATPAYKQILTEMEQNDLEGFNAMRYFTYHPDLNIAQIAVEIATDKYQLSKIHEQKGAKKVVKEEDRAREFAIRALSEMINATIDIQIHQLEIDLRNITQDGDVISIFKKLQLLNEQKKRLAMYLGERVVAPPTRLG